MIRHDSLVCLFARWVCLPVRAGFRVPARPVATLRRANRASHAHDGAFRSMALKVVCRIICPWVGSRRFPENLSRCVERHYGWVENAPNRPTSPVRCGFLASRGWSGRCVLRGFPGSLCYQPAAPWTIVSRISAMMFLMSVAIRSGVSSAGSGVGSAANASSPPMMSARYIRAW